MVSSSPRFAGFILGGIVSMGAALAVRAAEPSKRLDLELSPPTLPSEVIPGPGEVTRMHGAPPNLDGNSSGNDGVPVAGGKDCDGDGFNDFAFAHIKADPLGRLDAGQVTLFFGDGTIGATVDTAGFDPDYLKVIGDASDETTGAEIWIDDVTGDGRAELIIGRQNYTLAAAGRSGAGALTIILGDPDLRNHVGGYFDLRTPPGDVKIVTFVGASAYDRLGIWMRTGDIDGDGLSDIAVGADEFDDPEAGTVTENGGTVYVIRGGAHLATAPAIVDLADFGSTVLEGHLAQMLPPPGKVKEHFGATVQVGDLDGNGRAEVLVAATIDRAGAGLRLPGAPAGTGEPSSRFLAGDYPRGAVFIAWDENFPPTPWPAGYRFIVTEPILGDFTMIEGMSGPQMGPRNVALGEEMMTADFSGDGFPDLFCGDLVGISPNGSNSGLGHTIYSAANLRGRTIDLSNPPADVFSTLNYGPRGGAFGSDTVACGDFDDDGIMDLGIGNPCDDPQTRNGAGTVHVFYGQPGGWPALVDESPTGLPGPGTMRIAQIDGARAEDTLNYSSAPGDINHDGIADLVVNEMKGDGFGGTPVAVGNVLVVSGTALLPPFTPSVSFSVAGPVDYGARDIADGATAAIGIAITNTSGGTLHFTAGPGLTGPAAAQFAIVSDSGEASLGAGLSRTLQIAFDPTARGRHGAALTVSTSIDAHPAGIALRGIGTDATIAVQAEEYLRFAGADWVRFETQAGYTYELRRSANLTDWTTVLGGIEGRGGIVPVLDAGAPGGPRQFYRVICVRNGTP